MTTTLRIAKEIISNLRFRLWCFTHGIGYEEPFGDYWRRRSNHKRIVHDRVEVVRYRNAGRPKIYDDAMAWILIGFVMYPIDAFRTQVWALRVGYSVSDSFGFWRYIWRRQMDVWESL